VTEIIGATADASDHRVPVLRKAMPTDLDAVAALFLRCWRGYADVLPGRVVTLFDEAGARALWRGALETPRPNSLGLVAVHRGSVVGVIRIGRDPDEPTVGHVFSLYVDPDFHGVGIGGQLLAEADRWFASEGLAQSTLWVFEANVQARAFYARHGRRPDGGARVEPEYGEREIRLRSTINQAAG
jgi:GNAT superfamily N-acetyltransferase